MVIIKGAGWHLRKNTTFGDLGDEEGVIIQIYGVRYAGTKTRIDSLCQQIKTVLTAFQAGKTLKFICIPTGLETKSPKQFEFCIGRKAAQVKQAGAQYHIMGQVFLKHTYSDAWGMA